MPSVYPGGFDNLASNKANATPQLNDHPDHHNDIADAVNAVQDELGLNPSGVDATVAARITADEADLAAHVGDAVDAHDASAVSNVPAGSISATTVQAALNELDTDKASAVHTHPLSDLEQSGATDGQVPVWDNGLSEWVADDIDDHIHANDFVFGYDEQPGYNDGTVTGFEGRMLNKPAVMDAQYVDVRNTLVQVGGGLDNQINRIFFSQIASASLSPTGQWIASSSGVFSTTSTIAFINGVASPAEVQTGLETLYGAGNVSVTQSSGVDPLTSGPGNDYEVEFIGALAGTPVIFKTSNWTLALIEGVMALPSQLVHGNDPRLIDVLDDISDVDAPAPTTGDVLAFNGVDWVNDPLIAGDVANTPAGNIAAVTVQAALNELDTEKAATSHTHVEADITDLQAYALDSSLTAHTGDAIDAHDASAISNVPAGGISATDVQAALNELDTEKASSTDLSNHLADAIDAHDASAISNIPAGNIAATDVQSALNELDTEKSATTHVHTYRITHTFAIGGGVSNVTLPRHFVNLTGTQTATIEGAYVRLSAGTATINVRQNGSSVSGLGALAATTSSGLTNAGTPPAAVTGDTVDVVITAATGASDLSVSVVIQYVVAVT